MQVETLDANIKREHGAKAYFPFLDRRQGIVHVIGPEQGATLPGMTVVCGDSHTSTHGAFAALAFGIGTSEVEHVLATQCLAHAEGAARCSMRVDGRAAARASRRRTSCCRSSAASAPRAAPGYAIEFGGEAIRALSMEGAHDGLQHGDRGRRARRHGRRRPDARSTTCAAGRSRRRARCGTAPSPTGARWSATPARRSTRRT